MFNSKSYNIDRIKRLKDDLHFMEHRLKHFLGIEEFLISLSRDNQKSIIDLSASIKEYTDKINELENIE